LVSTGSEYGPVAGCIENGDELLTLIKVWAIFFNPSNICFSRRTLFHAYRFKFYFIFVPHDGRIILRWIFCKWDMGVWTGLSWLRLRTGGGHL
jgi:hypothetical protein